MAKPKITPEARQRNAEYQRAWSAAHPGCRAANTKRYRQREKLAAELARLIAREEATLDAMCK